MCEPVFHAVQRPHQTLCHSRCFVQQMLPVRPEALRSRDVSEAELILNPRLSSHNPRDLKKVGLVIRQKS